MDHENDDDEVRGALLKALGVVVAIAVLIALGTLVVVRGLGLDDSTSPGSTATVPSGAPRSALPTKALPVPGESASAEASETPSASASPGKGTLELSISPLQARAGERVNLTGRYRGSDNVELQVQRFEAGSWRDFGVSAPVRVGRYATYVMTGRTGEQRFRMWDPAARRGSNVVLVTIG